MNGIERCRCLATYQQSHLKNDLSNEAWVEPRITGGGNSDNSEPDERGGSLNSTSACTSLVWQAQRGAGK